MKPLLCPLTGINIISMLIAATAAFVVIFTSDYLVHHVMLMDIYRETAHLWRSPDVMNEYFPYMLGGYILISIGLSKTFAIFARRHTTVEGIFMGTMIGFLLGISAASSYVFMPIPAELALYWFLSITVQFGIAGGAIGLVYKP